MNEFVKMDVFFFITTVAVVLFTAFGVVIFLRFSRILKNIEHISQQVSLESDNIRGDLAEVRSDIRRGKGKLKSLLGFFGKLSKRASKNT
jgi:membrane protein implicated in regulation of membrane protease activity